MNDHSKLYMCLILFMVTLARLSIHAANFSRALVTMTSLHSIAIHNRRVQWHWADIHVDSLWSHYSHVVRRCIPKLWVKYDVLVRKNRVDKLELLLIYKIFTSTSFSFNLSGETCLTPIRKVYQYGQTYGPESFTLTSYYLSVLLTSFTSTTCW